MHRTPYEAIIVSTSLSSFMASSFMARPPELPPRSLRARDVVDTYGHTDQIRVKMRDFR
jgi:hypothetical protein